MTFRIFGQLFSLALLVWGCGDVPASFDDQGFTAAQSRLTARDDVVIAARPGQGLLVDVLANDRGPGRISLRAVRADVPGTVVDVVNERIKVVPPAGFSGILNVDYDIQSAFGFGRARLRYYVDSYFDDVVTELMAGPAGQRMIDAYDEDQAAPFAPRLALVVHHRGRRILERTWGGFEPLSTRMPMASATKWFAAALTLIARDEQRIRLDDSFDTYLNFANPELDGSGPQRSDITFRQAFSMSSGLYSLHRYHTMRALTHQRSVQTIRDSQGPGNGITTGSVPMEFAGGTMVGYDGKAMQVAGLAILRAYDGAYDWASLAEEKLFGPCEMNDTTHDAFYPNNPAVAGGAQTTANDYMKFLTMIENGGRCGDTVVLSAASIADLFRIHLEPDTGPANMTPIYASPWPNCGSEPYGDGRVPDDCSQWVDGTPTDGTLYPNGHQTLRYGFGAWVLAETDGVVEALTSPGAWGTAPFIDRSRDLSGIMFTYVRALDPDGVKPVTSVNTYVFRRLRAKIDAVAQNLAPAINIAGGS